MGGGLGRRSGEVGGGILNKEGRGRREEEYGIKREEGEGRNMK